MCAHRGQQPTGININRTSSGCGGGGDVKMEMKKETTGLVDNKKEDGRLFNRRDNSASSPSLVLGLDDATNIVGDTFYTARSNSTISRLKLPDDDDDKDQQCKKLTEMENKNFKKLNGAADITSIIEIGDCRNSKDSIESSEENSPLWLTAEKLEEYANREKHRKARHYYKKQMKLLKNFRSDKECMRKFLEEDNLETQREPEEMISRTEDILSKLTLLANILLLTAKAVAAALSGSLVVIGSVVDSATDITAGLVIYLTNRAIMKRDMYEYPRGRTRLQPIALVIISVIMGACSVQVISKSLESMARGNLHTDVEIATIVIMVCTIVLKFTLMIICYMYRSPSTLVLAQDHRNDTISNSVALICAYLANKFWIYLDPIAAIVVSLYILITWLRTGNEHVKALSGKAAQPQFINRIVKICLDHRPELKQIDTVYAYHYGTKYLVEVDVVLDEALSLKEAHDIAEPLQRKLEHLADVERAFVHIDYETDHRPEYEHKVV